MINLQWIEDFILILGWEGSMSTFNLWLLFMLAIGLGVSATSKNDIGRVLSKVRCLFYGQSNRHFKKSNTDNQCEQKG